MSNCNWMLRSIELQAFKIILRWRRLVLQNRRAVIGASIHFDKTCGARALNRLSFGIAFWIFATVLMVANAKAQDAEPRSYTNTPVGLNFLIAGYVYSAGQNCLRSRFCRLSTHNFMPIPGF